ncbi:leucine rich repeat and sterile alpha motif containing 1 [Nesidiocoris tenuis]|uniref:Leucine rich repeat and sterile alpha motif containing 1 n=1 Tax=Nesidiocoris tenuis TaxID=355587 RepID=A0ABN7BFA0_9HEMI|nr:leucine rich repeat and sterile alpha motif containing 1 [Nesidiocoris tenuis]
MSFFRRNQKGIDFKARLEHKLYLAKEDPDPSFDLSNCDLKAIPKGVYAVCKVLRKESLILHHNSLTSLSGGGDLTDLSLITVLDLSSNSFTSLPDTISCLTNLQELYLNTNLIKAFPETITDLKWLRILSAPFNRLKKLPANVGSMENLEELYLQGNPALCSLPDTLSLCPRLSHLALDVGRYTHPPNDIVLEGTAAVLTFLAAQIGIEYNGVANYSKPQESATRANERNLQYLSSRDQRLQEKILEFEKKKGEKKLECLALENEIANQKENEMKVHNTMKEEKDKLMEGLKLQQMKIAQEVLKFQSKKDTERNKLIDTLKKIEDGADSVISRMLEMGKSEREPWRLIQQQELDRIAEETLFHENLCSELRKKDVLAEMERMLEMETAKAAEYEGAKARAIQESLSKEQEWDRQLSELLSDRSRDQNSVVSQLSDDERAQEAAVAKLLEQNDLESAKLKAQLKIIEKQLAELTRFELKKRKFNMEQTENDLAEKRVQLSSLLVSVLRQQDDRKNQLLSRLKKMERHRLEDEQEDYWVIQYQKLLESQTVLNIQLVEQMVLHGVHKHLPLLLGLDLYEARPSFFEEIGVSSDESHLICKAIRTFLNASVAPSAPEDPSPSPSAPSDCENECVVCMNDQCQVAFVPCGHLCCCQICSSNLSICPICRGEIDKKISVILC